MWILQKNRKEAQALSEPSQYCSRQELVLVVYLGAAAVNLKQMEGGYSSSKNRTIQSIQKEMGQFYPNGKTFCQSRIADVLEQTLEKEPYVIHNKLPRGKLFKHDYAITDMQKHVKKIRKMLSVKHIRNTFSFDQKRIQWIVTCYNS